MDSFFAFPDEVVSQTIEAFAVRNNLKIVRCDNSIDSDGDKQWSWHLNYPGSPIDISIKFIYPSYISTLWFQNGDKGFSIQQYLDQHSKSTSDLETLKRIARDRSWPQDWAQQLDILEMHLATDLGRVVRGDFWPNIEFRMEDYFSPEAIDQMHQDSLKRLKTPENPNPWLYIVDFFKGKPPKK